ncbi:NAD(P)H-quinone oxidoreductase [Methylomonas sp. EFPC1]|uniref:NAD(P)H-quinone oxidoreductase n=1 Tax=Methylomonas sp. EFPC1 TaxID=2812647 RepID=UPI001966FC44|nr:NAD(P)H-quinone oxidoreductase [Methylomonas sp. EFPC1]QSB02718.1 NAD(P)H-quinone oxidoreductase [Methylomonas sp. EFPC1]
MRAIEIYRSSELTDLIVADQALPSPAPHQVLIKVAAAGVNRPDLMQRKGLYPPPPGASPVLGLEVAGTITELGSEVKDLKIGDPVCALLTGGGYAEYSLASACCCLPIPQGFSFIQAAALPETFFTVWSNLFDRAKLQAGESLLVHGGTSGIGTSAIQLGKAFGSQVIVTAGSDDKCQFCRELGADLSINYRQQDFVEAVMHQTDGKGVDVILDMIGGDYLPRNLKCLAIDGRLQQIAIQNGGKSEINLASVLMKRLTIAGTTLRPRNDDFKAKIAQQLFAKVWPLLESGQIKPIIDSVFPLARAAQAHERMESSQHIGKIILEI